MVAILTLTPSVQYGGPAVTSLADVTARTPAVLGSVSDDSDATYTRLWADWTTATHRDSDVLAVEFDTLDPSVDPIGMVMQIRARTPPGTAGDLTSGETWIATEYGMVGESSHYDNWTQTTGTSSAQLSPLIGTGGVADPAWYSFYFLGSSAVDPAAYDPDTWREVNFDGEFFAHQSLTTTGLRFSIFCYPLDIARPDRAYLDIFEVRLLVAYNTVAPATRRRPVPALRQHPRDDGLGMSSAPRVDANRSQQRSLRVAGGTYI